MVREYILEDKILLDKLYKDNFNIKKTYDDDTNIIKVYLKDNKIIGFIDYNILYERAELNYIFVLETERKKGIASILFKNMMDDLKEKKVLSITLEVNKNNQSAINLYQKNGFKIINERINYYPNGDDAYLMYLEVL